MGMEQHFQWENVGENVERWGASKPYCLFDVFLFSQWRFQGSGEGKAKTRAASFANLASQAASGRWKAFKSVVTWRITNTAERANHRPPVLWRSLKNYSASARREQTALCLNFHPALAIHPAHCKRERERGTMKEALFRLQVIEPSTSFLCPKTPHSIYHLVGDAPPPWRPVKKARSQRTVASIDIGLLWHWALEGEFAWWNTGVDCAGGNGSKNPRKPQRSHSIYHSPSSALLSSLSFPHPFCAPEKRNKAQAG